MKIGDQLLVVRAVNHEAYPARPEIVGQTVTVNGVTYNGVIDPPSTTWVYTDVVRVVDKNHQTFWIPIASVKEVNSLDEVDKMMLAMGYQIEENL